MPDSIDNAVAKSNGSPPPEEEPKLVRGALPPNKDELVAKQRPKAKAHADKCEEDRTKLEKKEKDEKPEPAKKEFTPKKLEDAKFDKFIEYCTKINEVAKERTATSMANIQKGKELFTFPLKGAAAAPAKPAPDIPTNS